MNAENGQRKCHSINLIRPITTFGFAQDERKNCDKYFIFDKSGLEILHYFIFDKAF